MRKLYLLSALLIVGFAGFASAGDIICGMSITEDTVLEEDLICGGNALHMWPNVELDCDGYSIIGSGSGNGIRFYNDHHATVKNCNVENFSHGIEIQSSHHNYIINNTIYNMNRIKYIAGYGIYFVDNSPFNTISNNEISDVDGVGIYIAGSPNNLVDIKLP